MKRAGFLVIVAMLAVLHSRAQTVVAEPFPPAKISSLYIERDEFRGAAVSVQLKDDTLIYRRVEGGKEVDSAVVHPSDDDWFAFIQALNAAKVYKWAPKYYYPGQGASWVIDLDMADRKFNSSGTNEFPKEGDEAQPQANPRSGPSIPFQLFWQAVLKLAGRTLPQPK